MAWPGLTPKDLALGLGIEAGELAELFLWKKEDEIRAAMQDPDFRQRLGEEMADVLVFLLYLAEASGIDLGAAGAGSRGKPKAEREQVAWLRMHKTHDKAK